MIQRKIAKVKASGDIRSAFKNEAGAIDLASIMVGIIVIGLIGGVIAATVFIIIPWAQDNAAKQQLDSVVAAESAYVGLSSSGALPTSHPENSYGDSGLLADAKLLTEGSNYCAVDTLEGKGYVAFSLSASGNLFYITDQNTKPGKTSGSQIPLDSACDSLRNRDINEPEYESFMPQTTTLVFRCDAEPFGGKIQIPLNDFIYDEYDDVKMTWSDGVVYENLIEYWNTGGRDLEVGKEYTVTVEGRYKQLVGRGDSCFRGITHWGADTGVTDINWAFRGSSSIDRMPPHLPPTVTDLSNLFRDSTAINDPNIGKWDVSNVTNMAGMFSGWQNSFNQPLNDWDVSNVKDMNMMFYDNPVFNQPLDNWKPVNVTNMRLMFAYAKDFNGALNGWDVSNVKDMGLMFTNAQSFNQPLNGWKLGSVEDMGSMFSSATAFNQNINDWDVSSVTIMNAMFAGAQAFNQPLDKWDVSNVTTIYSIFGGTPFMHDISNWNTQSIDGEQAVIGNHFPAEYLPPKLTTY